MSLWECKECGGAPGVGVGCVCRAPVADDWTPTPANINALPDRVRAYIHDLVANSDPSGMVAENTLLRDQTKQLDAMISRLKQALNSVGGCFEAANCEGLPEALAETNDERLKDLVERRLMYANEYARAALASAPVAGEAKPFAVLAVHKNGEIRSYSTAQALADAPIQDHERELQRKYGYELVTVYAAPQASEAVGIEEAFAGIDQLAALQSLKEMRRELHACQAVIHLAGGFDPAYVTGAQAAIKRADAVLSAQPGAQRTGEGDAE